MSPGSSLLSHLVIVVIFFRTPTQIGAQCNLATIYGLKTADCMNLELTSVPRTLDTDLKTLNFHGNRLARLTLDTFAAYPSLQNLYLVRNTLEAIAPDAFRQLQNLQILDLEGNRLTAIPSESFAFTPSLRFLSLRSNPISYVTNADLAHLRNIEVLNLENCWLKRIEPRAFHDLPKLYELNLVNNELQGLSGEMADTLWSGLAILRLHNNPWQCDCRLRWLRIRVSSVPNWDFGQNTPTCAGPELLKGVTWKQLVPDQFACASSIVGNATTIQELIAGANASIECVVSGDPQPSVTWMKGSRFVADDLVSHNTFGDRDPKLVRSVVTLRDVSQADANDYKCIAVNTAGRSEVTYKVVVARGGDGGSGKHSPDAVAGTGLIVPEMVLGVAVTGIGLVGSLLMCVTCAVVRVRERARSNRKLVDSPREAVPVDGVVVGPSPTEEDGFSSSGSECPSSPSGSRDSTAFDSPAAAVSNEANPKTTNRTPASYQGNTSGSHCRRVSETDHLPSKQPPIAARQASLVEPNSAEQLPEIDAPPEVPLKPEAKRGAVPIEAVPDDSVTPDLLSDRHVINFRSGVNRIAEADVVVELRPTPPRKEAAVCAEYRSGAPANDRRVRGDDRAVGENCLNMRPRGEPTRGQPPRGQPYRGEPCVDEPLRCEPLRGEPVRGEPPKGQPPRGQPHRDEPSRGGPRDEPSRGEPIRGVPYKGEAQRGEPHKGESTRGAPRDEPHSGESPWGEIHESPRRQRATSVEMRPFCDNPICLRERQPSCSSSHGGVARGKITEGGGGGGEGRSNGGVDRLLPVAAGSVCSHRLALRKDTAQPSSLLSGRPTPRPSSSQRNRAYPRRSGIPSDYNTSTTCESYNRDHPKDHRRSNGSVNHPLGRSYTLSRNPGPSRIWASQQCCEDNDLLQGRTRNGRIPSGYGTSRNESGRTPVFCMRASSGGLDREDDFDDPFPVPLNRRQTFSSMSLNEILSPPFGINAYRQSGAFEGQRTRTGSRRELEDQGGTAV